MYSGSFMSLAPEVTLELMTFRRSMSQTIGGWRAAYSAVRSSS